MVSLIIISTIVTLFAIACVFYCGAYWCAAKDEEYGFDLEVFPFMLAIVCIGMSILCWTETGKARVKTRELPTIERKVTLREQEGEIKSDTLYIFKFR